MLHPTRLVLLIGLSLITPSFATAFVQPTNRLRSPARTEMRERPSTVPVAPGGRADLAAWRSFRQQHGDWRATWAQDGLSPRSASGPPIRLLRTPASPATIDRALQSFVASHADLFGTASLELVRCIRAGRVWYVSYRQQVGGVPVLFEDWEFRVNQAGGLMAFRTGGRGADPRVETRPGITAAMARDLVRAGLALDPLAGRIEGGERLHLLSVEDAGLRLVREVTARSTNPPAHWVVLVDALDGRILWQHDRVRYAISGVVSGEVHPRLPSDLPLARSFANLRVTVGPGSTLTGPSGTYTATASGSVQVGMALAGPFCDVERMDGLPDAAYSTSVSDPAMVDHQWSALDSHDAERDCFYHVNRVHDELKALDPGFVGNDYPMPCAVNIANTCNAFWDGQGINFFMAGNGCENTGVMPDVIYHEYGHGVNDNLYVQAGSLLGMQNGALHEGLADVLAAFIQDTPVMGKGFFGPGTSLRTLDNMLRWPQDASPDPHFSGLILGGALWDLRESVGLATAAHLAHFAKYGRPDDFDDGVAMGEFFVETLIADDNDGDLSNGTPHAAAIADAFNAHGIGSGSLLTIGHAPPGDQVGPGPYPLYALMGTASPLGMVAPGSQQIWFSVNGGGYASLPMTATGSGDEYFIALPVPEGSVVRYYFQIADTYGGTRTDPAVAELDPYIFLAGSVTSHLIHDHETNAGWSVGYPGDGASTGIWAWVEPTGTDVGGIPCQPEVNHTQSGLFCYATGNALVGDPAGTNDVDDGATSLVTALFDLTAAGPAPLIEYYRWYSNQLGGAPFEDTWRVYITNDGGLGWFPVEATTFGDSRWRRVVFFVNDIVAPTDLVKLRFVAEDAGEPSLVEAAVDDFRVLSFNSPALDVQASPASRPDGLWASPNPSANETRIEFCLAVGGLATLALYDVAGRRVRDLFSGPVAPGSQMVRWDGRDRDGRTVANGLYLARLRTDQREWVCRIARTR